MVLILPVEVENLSLSSPRILSSKIIAWTSFFVMLVEALISSIEASGLDSNSSLTALLNRLRLVKAAICPDKTATPIIEAMIPNHQI